MIMLFIFLVKRLPKGLVHILYFSTMETTKYFVFLMNADQ